MRMKYIERTVYFNNVNAHKDENSFLWLKEQRTEEEKEAEEEKKYITTIMNLYVSRLDVDLKKIRLDCIGFWIGDSRLLCVTTLLLSPSPSSFFLFYSLYTYIVVMV